MTTDERFERIEHVTAALVEERRKDREEYRALWRDTQNQIHDLTLQVAATNDAVARLAEETRASIDKLAEESRAATARLAAADAILETRIGALVSAIGEFIAANKRVS
jgi:hypothetical protein